MYPISFLFLAPFLGVLSRAVIGVPFHRANQPTIAPIQSTSLLNQLDALAFSLSPTGLVNKQVGKRIGRLVERLVDILVERLVDSLVDRLVERLVERLVNRLVERLMDTLVGKLSKSNGRSG